MTILVDISTITNFAEVLLKENNRWYNKIHTYNEITSYDWFEKAFTNPWEPLNHKSFWNKVIVNQEAKNALESFIKMDHSVFLVSASDYNDCLGYKINTTLRNFDPNLINEKNVIISKNKNLIKGDILIDDCIDNLNSFDAIKICYTQPWNKDFNSTDQNSIRTRDWNLIKRIIQLYSLKLKK